MRCAIPSALAAGLLATCLAGAASAAAIEVVSAGAEYAALHPHAKARPATGEGFEAAMDRVFGAGRWRETSGYRTRAQEDALRRQGAGTVAPGHTSLHSVGDPSAPGAYDAVVDHMAAASAAAKLRSAGVPFARVVAERAHGAQGPHLHVELTSAAAARRPAPQPSAED